MNFCTETKNADESFLQRLKNVIVLINKGLTNFIRTKVEENFIGTKMKSLYIYSDKNIFNPINFIRFGR